MFIRSMQCRALSGMYMNDNEYFDDEDEKIFSDEDISYDTPSKVPRIVSAWLMTDFLAWLDRFHPELRMVSLLPQRELSQLIKDFEFSIGKHYNYEVQDWRHSLKGR